MRAYRVGFVASSGLVRAQVQFYHFDAMIYGVLVSKTGKVAGESICDIM